MKKLSVMCLVLVTVIMPGVMLAEVANQQGRIYLDSDQDGFVTRVEYQAVHDRIHDQLKARLEVLFNRLDINGDGQLSKKEFVSRDDHKRQERVNNQFTQLDKNADGKISAAELEAAQNRMRQKP